jgi:hypothetical protein
VLTLILLSFHSRESTAPVGPLFFSGLIKSRTLTQLKRRLLELIQYHGSEATALKGKEQKPNKPKPTTSRTAPKSDSTSEDKLTAPLSLKDLTGESSDSSESDSDEDDVEQIELEEGRTNDVSDDVTGLLAYHVAAER